MELFEYYLRYLTALCEGSLQVPGLTPGQGDETARAMALQQQIAAMGLPEFVRRCAAAEGTRIPQAVYDSYDPQALAQAMQALLAKAGQEAPQDAPGQQAEKAPEKESGEDGQTPRQNAYEAMLDAAVTDELPHAGGQKLPPHMGVSLASQLNGERLETYLRVMAADLRVPQEAVPVDGYVQRKVRPQIRLPFGGGASGEEGVAEEESADAAE